MNVVFVLCAACAVISVPRGVVHVYDTLRPFFTALFLRLMFWYSLPAPTEGGHDYNNLPMRKDEWIGRKNLFDEKKIFGLMKN